MRDGRRVGSNAVGAALAIAVGLLLALAGCGATATAPSTPFAGPTSAVAPGSGVVPPRAVTDLPTVAWSTLPEQARTTLRLIADGGPFPYRKDGATFSNRERLLPRQPDGYYREYTVVTPGSDDRGARRIVTGRSGERFWTDDHYDSFREVVVG